MYEYTPSTMSIREVWSFARAMTGDGIDHEQARAEFDRWLTALDGEIRTDALEDAADQWSDWETFRASDGIISIRQHSQTVSEWLRARAAKDGAP